MRSRRSSLGGAIFNNVVVNKAGDAVNLGIDGVNAGVDGVGEKFGEQNFRVLSEMRIFGTIRVVILDFCRVSKF